MADIPSIKSANAAAIGSKTEPNSITPSNVNDRLDAIADELRPYKEYIALLNQSGENAPVATIISNTIGEIVWSYEDMGVYQATLTGAFTQDKTYMILGSEVNTSADFQTERITNSAIELTVAAGGNPIDDALINKLIEIRVYP